MINISKLYCGQVTPGDWLRYGKKVSGERENEIVYKDAATRRPVVVWNVTRACILNVFTATMTAELAAHLTK